jgi:hypothetical protein
MLAGALVEIRIGLLSNTNPPPYSSDNPLDLTLINKPSLLTWLFFDVGCFADDICRHCGLFATCNIGSLGWWLCASFHVIYRRLNTRVYN